MAIFQKFHFRGGAWHAVEAAISPKIVENVEKAQKSDFKPLPFEWPDTFPIDLGKSCYLCGNFTTARTREQIPVCESCQHRHFGEKVENSEKSTLSARPENPKIENLGGKRENPEFCSDWLDEFNLSSEIRTLFPK